jgi:hypothetical protein
MRAQYRVCGRSTPPPAAIGAAERGGNMNSGVIRGAERKILHAPLDLAFAKEGYTASSLTHLLVKYPKNVWVG